MPNDGQDGKEAYKHKKMHKQTQTYVNQGEGKQTLGRFLGCHTNM